VGTPVVGIFGPTNPERNGPWSAGDISVSRFEQCSCAYQRRCSMSSRCIDAIAAADVAGAAERRLGSSLSS
jgi:heptosyltransferase-1